MKSLIPTAVSIFLCCAGAAGAQQAMHEGHKTNGSVSMQEYQSLVSNVFIKLDADKNGALTQSETSNVLTGSQFPATDTNDDGRVSRSEFSDRVMQDFSTADKSGDGHLQ